MSDIFDTREDKITFSQIKKEPIFSEYLTDAREIMKQCVIDDCFAITKDLGNRLIGLYTIFCRIRKNDQIIMKYLHHSGVK